MENKKELKIYKSINEFFLRCIEMKDNGTLEKYLKFLRKVRIMRPLITHLFLYKIQIVDIMLQLLNGIKDLSVQ